VLKQLRDDAFGEEAGLLLEASSEADILTRREREVADLMIEGLSNQEIAQQLFISQATVKVHLRHIYEKLGVRNRAGATAKLHQATRAWSGTSSS
jgi:ATP/maltotriose-dependent transcriptional regulator MalT